MKSDPEAESARSTSPNIADAHVADAHVADAIIVGGGIHGASLAFHLANKGLKPLVLERRSLASQATGYSSGLVRMHYDLEPESLLAWKSFAYFRNWSQIVGGHCGFTRTGFIQIVRPQYTANLRANVSMHQRLGIPELLVTAQDVGRLAPYFAVDDFEVAAYEPESGYADPTSAARSLMQAAREKGARLQQDAEVVAIDVQAGKVSAVQVAGGARYSAPLVINAAGAWAGQVARMVGLELPIKSWWHETMFVRRPPEMGSSHPTVIDDIHAMYFRPETGGLTLVGLEDGNPIADQPSESSGRARTGFVERAAERICRRIPAMEKASLHSALGGSDGITPDQRAILGQAGPQGFYLCCGFSGTGFKIAPAVGACLAELIVDGQAQTVDISPFSLERFESGRLLEGEHAYQNIWL
jgi:sarcosine oxidase subunit beta